MPKPSARKPGGRNPTKLPTIDNALPSYDRVHVAPSKHDVMSRRYMSSSAKEFFDRKQTKPEYSILVNRTPSLFASKIDQHVKEFIESATREIESTVDDLASNRTPSNEKWLDLYESRRRGIAEDAKERRRVEEYRRDHPEIYGPVKAKEVPKAKAPQEVRPPSPKATKTKPPVELTKWIEPQRWNHSNGRNNYCTYCQQPVTWCKVTEVGCKYCSAVAHIKCLPAASQPTSRRRNWRCSECQREVDMARKLYLEERMQRHQDMVVLQCQAKVAATWRGIIAMRKYKSFLKGLVGLQALRRCLGKRLEFKRHRYNMERPARLEIMCAEGIAASDWDTGASDPYILVSILNHKHRQIWRAETDTIESTLDPTFDESFIIPGMNAATVIVFTVIDRDEIRDQFLGQTVITFDPREFIKGRVTHYHQPLRAPQYHPVGQGGQALNIDYTGIVPQGTLRVSLHPFINISSICGFVDGPSLSTSRGEPISGSIPEKGAKKVWAVLAEDRLHLYKTKGEMKPKGVISLSRAKIKIDQRGDHLKVDVIHKGGATLSLRMRDEINRWRTAFQLGIHKIQLTRHQHMDALFNDTNWNRMRTRVWKGKDFLHHAVVHGATEGPSIMQMQMASAIAAVSSEHEKKG